MKNIKETIIKKQYAAVIFFLGLMLVMVIRMGKNIKTSEIKSSIEMKTPQIINILPDGWIHLTIKWKS